MDHEGHKEIFKMNKGRRYLSSLSISTRETKAQKPGERLPLSLINCWSFNGDRKMKAAHNPQSAYLVETRLRLRRPSFVFLSLQSFGM